MDHEDLDHEEEAPLYFWSEHEVPDHYEGCVTVEVSDDSPGALRIAGGGTRKDLSGSVLPLSEVIRLRDALTAHIEAQGT